MDERPWHARIDRVFWGAIAVALIVRVAFAMWPLQGSCVRDECSYQLLAHKIAEGRGLQPHAGWLWAPVHPYVFGGMVWLFGEPMSMKALQVLLSTATVGLTGWLGRRLSPRTGQLAAWLTALHPTLAFFAATYWSETLYSFVLLAGLCATLRARGGERGWAALAGVLIGLTVLSRGIATLLPPLFLLALLWPETGSWRDAWTRLRRSAATLVTAMVLTVAPYSLSASQAHGGLIVSDATIGQQFYFGNNRFEPISFDYGNGLYSDAAMRQLRRSGRKQCPRSLGLVAWNRCETANGIAFIREDPSLFLRRVPLRWAQLLNPHTFLTRHARWGRFIGLPWQLKEGLSLAVLLYSFGLMWGGSLALWRRARGELGAFSVAIWLYYLAVIGCFFGISRLRLPLEPLLIVWVAHLLAERGEPVPRWRRLGGWCTLVLVVPLTLWFLPHGLPIAW